MSKTFFVEMQKAIHISVDCEHNDRVDIRCGGPPILGFDFYVPADVDLVDYIKHIKACLRKNGRPCLGVSHKETTVKASQKLWSKKRIAASITKGY